MNQDLYEWLTANLIFLEAAYYVSGIFVFISAVVAIFALKAFRNEAKTRFKRESLKITLELIDEKRKQLIMLDDKFWEYQTGLSNCPVVPYSLSEFHGSQLMPMGSLHFDKSTLPDLDYYNYFHDDSSKILFNLAIDVLNELENISHFIFSGLIDAEHFYQIEAESIIFYIEKQAPNIAVLREHKNDDRFSGIVRLYNAWKPRCERKGLERKIQSLEESKQDIAGGEIISQYHGKNI